ncbi:PREDICTED: protein NLRC5 isoform X1 [Fragaria vesca subsp. vesca]|uniref:protein NLRC5 isoform X1 n=1 Tax=Fragaria vesca subsp. vesca TaxID=101020 RepID=UPI0002C37217|nr:PREDICTED: protein NLRC5 isoform X1 [Fragaria vesca subsp. vesca]
MTESEIPSLVSLCVDAVKSDLLRGDDDLLPILHELPPNLLDLLVSRLPPFALQKLHRAMPFDDREDEFSDECIGNGRKRGRSSRAGDFDKAWRNLFILRWPEIGRRIEVIEPPEWQQIYWETHLQNCLDEVAEVASLPSFDGCLGEVKISDSLLELIGCEGDMATSTSGYSKLRHHCVHFGYLARCLRLQNIFCNEEICHLLRNSKLQSLELRWIRSKEHITGVCKLLNQNSESLKTLEFIHCTLSSASITEICSSLSPKSLQAHGIKHFSINTTKFLETNPSSVPVELVSFLSSGRSLYSLKLSDNHLGQKFAKVLFSTLLNASSSLSILDLSENNISGWLSELSALSKSNTRTPLRVGKSLQSLRELNLRGNNLNKDDADDLRYALVHLPNLEVLDMSDNPIGDDGIRSLIPFLMEASEKCTRFVDLMLENCELSCHGVTELIKTLSSLSRPLKSLSIADNDLGSQVAGVLGEFLCTPIQVLNAGGIGLRSSGFQVLQEKLTKELKLVEIDISKNRGGIETANFLSKLMSEAPKLAIVNAAYNLMPVESLTAICSAIKNAKGTLQRMDLSGNTWDYQPVYDSMLADIQCNERLILILPSLTPDAPYDADP